MGKYLNVAIIKPVNGKCNLKCTYCYMDSILEPQKSNLSVMNFDVLRATIDFFCSHQDYIEFIWHGGEPLLAGEKFYRKAAEFQNNWKSCGKKIVNFLQTNGTLVNPKLANTLKELDFLVGVSMDAPQNAHNTLRKNKDGSCTFQKVLDGISKLKENDIFIGVSCCIGQNNFSRPKEIIDFFISNGIKKIKFLRIKDIQNKQHNKVINAGQYADFLIKVFEMWMEIDDPNIKSMVDIILGGNFRECVHMGRCDRFATVYSDGSIFPCDNFLNTPKYKFGTVFENYLKVTESDNFQSFYRFIEQLRSSCQKCEWFYLCQGGCSRERLENIDFQSECREKQRLFSKIKNTLLHYGLLQPGQ